MTFIYLLLLPLFNCEIRRVSGTNPKSFTVIDLERNFSNLRAIARPGHWSSVIGSAGDARRGRVSRWGSGQTRSALQQRFAIASTDQTPPKIASTDFRMLSPRPTAYRGSQLNRSGSSDRPHPTPTTINVY